ncbi:MAG: excinuclease ABC subunit UvrA, partial [Planctomycetota bacterium]
QRYFHAHDDKKSSVVARAAKSSKTKGAKALVESRSPALEDIHVQGAQQHNLKNIDVTVPRNAMTVFCGHSGSGKTSMAMDTIYAEGQRRFVESLSAYTRQFVGQMPKPVVERIDGLSPAVAIEQRGLSHTPRSTVGTVTEIYDYLRVFFARLAQMHCTRCDGPIRSQTIDQIVDRWLDLGQRMASTRTKAESGARVLLLAPVAPAMNQEPLAFFEDLKREGYARVRINGRTYEIDNLPDLNRKSRLELQVVVDRIQLDRVDRKRLFDSISTALQLGSGVIQMAIVDPDRKETLWDTQTFSLQLACDSCGISFQPLTPHQFSFNTGVGWCSACQGLGIEAGTDPAAFIDESLSLMQGGLLLWPDTKSPIATGMLRALGRHMALPVESPIRNWTSSQRSMLFRGLPEQEIIVQSRDLDPTSDSEETVMFYRFHGVYPALELLSNANPTVRMRLSAYLADVPCTQCDGSRIRPEAAHARFRNLRMADIVRMPIGMLLETVQAWKLSSAESKIAGELLREITQRLQFLVDVGLDYLTIDRSANSLSGGESQRIRLASQLGSGLSGVLYVLDEPTIGLHPRDNRRLIAAMHRLRDLGNTLLVVEHDRDVIANSDSIRDFGPGSGPYGGRVIAEGNAQQLAADPLSITGPFLSGNRRIEISGERTIALDRTDAVGVRDWTSLANHAHGWITVKGAKENTLKSIDVSFPLGALTAVTGPSGSGKSSLVNGILYPALARRLHRADLQPGPHQKIEGIEQINKVLQVDQSPLGNSPTSNPATYTGVFDHIRQLFSRLPEAKMRGLAPGAFSFNVGQGRCEKCFGAGQLCIQMHFLPDVWIPCDACQGRRYTEEVLAVKYRGNSINDVLNLSIGPARDLMSEIPKISSMLTVLCEVGLDSLALGHSAPTLSGG